MSQSHLPDDIARWPSDAFAVLGVPAQSSPLEFKRAYTRLIRVYKPEHSPEEFRRIRTAYEFVQHFAQFYRPPEPSEPVDQNSDADVLTSPQTPFGETRDTSSPAEEPIESAPRHREENSESLWHRAIEGDEEGAYCGLKELLERNRRESDIYTRLYWLLVLSPDLDERREPADWLAEGIRHTSRPFQLLELYRAEVNLRTVEAVSARCNRLISADLECDVLCTLLQLRWNGLYRLANWEAIENDIRLVRDRVCRESEAAWLRLMSYMLDRAEWHRSRKSRPLYSLIRSEIKALEHLAIHEAHWFDRFDELRVLVESWDSLRSLSDVPKSFLIVLRDGWFMSTEELQRPLEGVLHQISADPTQWIDDFDRAGPAGLAGLSHFGTLLSQYESDRVDGSEFSLSPAAIRTRVERHLERAGVGYKSLRGRVLHFCLSECIAPEAIVNAYLQDNGGKRPSFNWTKLLGDDLPLRTVCWACRLFRS